MKVQSGLCRCSLRLTAGGVLLWAAFLVPCRAELLENVRYSESSSAAVSAGSRATALVRKLRPAETIPVVDGRLDDACWQRPSAYLGKFRLGLTPVPAQHTREAWATYDSESLFIAVRLQREPGTALRVQTREPDNGRIWEDDEFEIFVDPFATGTAYYQMIMKAEIKFFIYIDQ